MPRGDLAKLFCEAQAVATISAVTGSCTPTLLKLKTLKTGDGKSLKIIQTITAGDYDTFGMLLLQDENGAAVKILKKDNIHDGTESVTQAILQHWLETSDSSTHTYQHLIECLRQSELGTLADLIADTPVFRGMYKVMKKISNEIKRM